METMQDLSRRSTQKSNTRVGQMFVCRTCFQGLDTDRRIRAQRSVRQPRPRTAAFRAPSAREQLVLRWQAELRSARVNA